MSLLIALALGGNPRNLARIAVPARALLYVALGVGLLPLAISMGRTATLLVSATANLLLLIFLAQAAARNSRTVRVGFSIVIIGWALNALVIGLNGGMPLSVRAYERSGQTDPVTPGRDGFFKIIVAGPDTTLSSLGDVVPIRPLRSVVSVGDLVLALGIGVVVVSGSRQRTAQ